MITQSGDSEPPSKSTAKTKEINVRNFNSANSEIMEFLEKNLGDNSSEYIKQINTQNENGNEKGYSINPEFSRALDFLNEELTLSNPNNNSFLPGRLVVKSFINIPKERDYRKEYIDEDEPEKSSLERGLGKKLSLEEYYPQILGTPDLSKQDVLLIKDLS